MRPRLIYAVMFDLAETRPEKRISGACPVIMGVSIDKGQCSSKRVPRLVLGSTEDSKYWSFTSPCTISGR
jgi:hypothetical protein